MSSTHFPIGYAEYPSLEILFQTQAWLNKDLVCDSRITSTVIPSPGSASRLFMEQKSALTVGMLGDSPDTSGCRLMSALA